MIRLGQTINGEEEIVFSGENVKELDFIVELAREVIANEKISEMCKEEARSAKRAIRFLQERDEGEFVEVDVNVIEIIVSHINNWVENRMEYPKRIFLSPAAYKLTLEWVRENSDNALYHSDRIMGIPFYSAEMEEQTILA